MIIVITISIIAVLLTLLAGYTTMRKGMLFAFILLTSLACIHYNYGNDYNSYFFTWNVISQNSLKECFSGSNWIFPSGVRPDVGWIILNKLFGFPGGFLVLVAGLSIFENVIYYNFIKSLVPRKWWWLAVFIYVFNYRFYVLNFSLLRQGLTICLGILAFYYFERKNYKNFVVTMSVAFSIHTSSIVLIPFVFICSLGSRNVKKSVTILSIATPVMFLATNLTTQIFQSIIGYNLFSKYNELYSGWTATGSYGLGFLLILFQYILMLWFLLAKNDNENVTERDKFLILMAYVALLIKPFEVIGAALVSRLEFYFSAFDIVALPLIYSKMNGKFVKAMLVIMLLVITLYSYYGFWTNPVYQRHFTEFHTIFESF